ncbi:hypothetical protein [Nannocystis pusilla]|uniref:hypothetical protein n=1 Tax=Nannocystis pusilla TaxID=889268 RepID=UPI003B7F3A2F
MQTRRGPTRADHVREPQPGRRQAQTRRGGRPELGGFIFLFAGADARASDLRGHVFVGARIE